MVELESGGHRRERHGPHTTSTRKQASLAESYDGDEHTHCTSTSWRHHTLVVAHANQDCDGEAGRSCRKCACDVILMLLCVYMCNRPFVCVFRSLTHQTLICCLTRFVSVDFRRQIYRSPPPPPPYFPSLITRLLSIATRQSCPRSQWPLMQ